MNDEERAATWRAIENNTSAVIAENLRDPDLAKQSADFHAGYARGFTEATIGHVLSRLKKSELASVRD